MRKRWDVLADLIREYGLKVGAEIGVNTGRNIEEVLRACPDFYWYAIDPWVPTENYARWPDESHAMHEARFDEVRARWPGRIKKMKAFSPKAAEQFEGASLDLVFIDGDHSYKGVRADIDAWLPKLREGGIIAGHDYDNTAKYGDMFKGVDKAVHETFETFYLDADYVWWCRA